MPTIRCTRCSTPYPARGTPYLCPICGGIFDFDGPPIFDPTRVNRRQPGMWQYLTTFDLPDQAPVVSLGEGNTPLIPMAYSSPTLENRQVWLKLESLNPSGSYKDRGSAVLLSQLAARGVKAAVEDSSGNAGASFAAYAARAGVQARVYVPESASGPKRNQIEAYGAELVCVPGPRSAAAEAVLDEVRSGATYASHAYLPFGLPGIATIAYEVWEQLGGVPGTVIAPAGHGGLLLGLVRGFSALHEARLIEKLPSFIGVQAQACAPLWQAFYTHAGVPPTALSVEEGSTAAEGVRVRNPVRQEAILREVSPIGNSFLAIPETEIMPAYQDLARRGVHVEPTSALAWAVLGRSHGKLPGPVVLILSGAGLKYSA